MTTHPRRASVGIQHVVILDIRTALGIDRAREEVDGAGKIALFERRVPRRFQFFHDDFDDVFVGVGVGVALFL